MRKDIYNLEKLVSIKVVDKKRYNLLEYKPFKKGWIKFFDDEAGFYSAFDTSTPYSKEQLETGRYNDINFLIENNKVFYTPYIKLMFDGDVNFCIDFQTYQEALDYANNIAKESFLKSIITENDNECFINIDPSLSNKII